MNTTLVVCDRITFNPSEKCHHLGKLINEIEALTLPAIIELHILVRLINIELHKVYELELQFLDDQKNIKGLSEKTVFYNRRSEDRIPGVDANFIIKGLVAKSTNYWVRLYVNGLSSYDYPIYVTEGGYEKG